MSATKSSVMRDHARKVLSHQSQQAGELHDAGTDHDEAPAPADAAFLAPSVVEVVKRISTPALPFPMGATYVLKIREAVRVSEVEDSKFGPARVSEVEALDGSVRLLIWNEVLHTAMQRAYPADDYVGRWFQITKTAVKEGKRGRYADFAIVEIKGPANPPHAAGRAAPGLAAE